MENAEEMFGCRDGKQCGWGRIGTTMLGCNGGSGYSSGLHTADISEFHTEELRTISNAINAILSSLKKPDDLYSAPAFISTPQGLMLAWVSHDPTLMRNFALPPENPNELAKLLGLIGWVPVEYAPEELNSV
ncbi:MAG: hypothetical protein WBD22_08110 [Pyrinomonadaceae bacterium]